MRHLGSLALSLVLAAIIYVLVGMGLSKVTSDTLDTGGGRHYAALAIGVLLLLAAGAIYAPMVLARLSPLGLILAGLVYLGVEGWALASPANFGHRMPQSVLGVRDALTYPPAVGAPLLLAVPLLFTVFSPRRWRRSGQPAAPAPYGAAPAPYGAPAPMGYPAYPSAPASPYAPAYPPPPVGQPYPGAPQPPVPTSVPPAPVSVPPGPVAPVDDENSATQPLYPAASSFPTPPPHVPPPHVPPRPHVPPPPPAPTQAAAPAPPTPTWPTTAAEPTQKLPPLPAVPQPPANQPAWSAKPADPEATEPRGIPDDPDTTRAI